MKPNKDIQGMALPDDALAKIYRGNFTRVAGAQPRGGLHTLYRRLQRYRPARNVGTSLLERRGPAHRRALREPLWGRVHAVQAGGSTGAGAAVGGQASTGVRGACVGVAGSAGGCH